jgi:hypothetical protein
MEPVPDTRSPCLGAYKINSPCCRTTSSILSIMVNHQRLVHNLLAFQQLPAAPCDACEKKTGRVSSLSLVRYRNNDYSVPTAPGHQKVVIRGYVHEVVISPAAQRSSRATRIPTSGEDFVFNPLYYLALIERKINALDQAAPLADWTA